MQNEVVAATTQNEQVEQTTCCIVGGGPAGAMLALLLARKGVRVVLLEEHMDFDRDFRGDTIHPSTLQILDEIGIADRLLQLRHTKASSIPVQTAKGVLTLADFHRLKTRFPYIALIPQADFLTFITAEASRYPNFRLVMGARAEKLIEEDGFIHGVHYRGRDGWHELRAILTIGADGRFSRLRRLAGFEPIQTSAPMDVLWFRLPRKAGDPEQSGGRLSNGHILIMLDRNEYWQIGYIIPKGGYQEIRTAGLDHLRQIIGELLPEFASRMDTIQEWKQVSVLSVESSRLRKWYLPGLLLIGDAAHVMSPVGGVGINYAIQDAVVAANILGNDLLQGKAPTGDLARVQRERELPTRIIQSLQNLIQKQVLSRVLATDKPPAISPFFSLLLRVPLVRDLPARFIAFGPRSVRVKE